MQNLLPSPVWTASLALLLASAAPLQHSLAAEAQAQATKTWDVNKPPGEARTIPIDTRSGTWMSVDISPDGKQLVFDLLGDLYLLPIAGGEAKALTHSIAWEQQARFSPDGKQIAFVSDAGGGDNIWLMNADGSQARAITKEDYRLLNNPVWHPSGKYIAARKHFTGTRSAGSGEIWLYHVDGQAAGNKGVQLNEKPNWQKDLGEPALSPDGKYLYYSQDTTPGRTFEYNKDSNKEIFKIFRQDLSDGSVEPFVQGPGGAIRPTPSPDGQTLAFVRRVRNQSSLFLKDLQTGRETPVWAELERDLQESWSVYGVYPSFAWTPDAKAIVVWAKGKLWRVDPFATDKTKQASEIPFHMKDTRELREALRFAQEVAPDQFSVKQLRWVHVSPEGKRVVYSALGQLYLKDLPDGVPKRITQQKDAFEFFPSFSRDGRELVYTSWNDEKLGSVRKLDLASGRETVLSQAPGKYLSPQFSPDGKTVVFKKEKGGYLTTPWHGLDSGVYVVAADGKTAPKRIAKSGDSPQFAERNDALYLSRSSMTSEVDSQQKLVRIDLTDRSETEVAKGEFVSQFSVSPDGQWLGFVERAHAYVTPLPRVGKPISVGPKMDGLPLTKLDGVAGEFMHWSGDSRQVHFSYGDELFSAPLAAGAKPAQVGQKIGFSQASDKPAGKIAITGARIATMKGDEVIENGVILVDGNRIAAIGLPAQVQIPPDAKHLDASGKTIIPGLIDAHWHGGMGESEIIPQQSWVNYASLAFGLTTIHDPSNRNGDIFSQAELQRAGRVVGPRIYSTGSILYGAKAGVTAVVNHFDDALTHLKRQKAAGAISVKSYQQPRREQRQQLLEAARQTGMMVVPEGGSMFQLNMSMIIDGHTGIEHALPVAEVYDDVNQLWTQTQVGYTPTLNVAYGGLDGEHYWYARTEVWKHPILSRFVPRTLLESRSVRRLTAPEEDFNVLRVAKTATALQRAGVPANIGAHGQREGLGAHWEMWMFGLGGMKPLEALRTATANPARYLGLDKDLGSLEVGKLADLLIIDGDVLADIRQSDRISHVMQNGRLYELPTMNEVLSRNKARKPFFFEGVNADVAIDETMLGHGHGED
ncbi:imidazolonepropionase-like amidohydrolase/Tol biopolymer transport system component [Paucibacter oligotrophus]|uniref:Imidazolonepropionase-like amidohydrolase/Tol biopolymer transport system component n=1 Tax=Roseateles oligotrophus TaxID=1769250 RepID=A0A840LA38_9BURK|nr:amidohydrolase family protein [Roseateles oligotrophus]MBB4844986.1 imidazolonepropionase-like amidohydrolase/Tol biopolymer transport system component [Roseateles oligotrophus]